jgi:catechol 2,3-dioxygenase-like lactoylglutathione lyase family enzyme
MEEMISNLLSNFENGKMSRRQLVQSLAITAATTPAASAVPALGAAAPKHFKAQTINHISYGVADYAKTRDFYVDLLGMKVVQDNGKQALMKFGDSLLIARKTLDPNGKPYVDHICYTIADFDEGALKAELERRGLNPKLDTGGGQHTFHVKDPDGFDLQIGGPLTL